MHNRKRTSKCDVLKNINLIDLLHKVRQITVRNQYLKQIMHATKLIYKKWLISFKNTNIWKAHHLTPLGEKRLYI